MPGPDEPHPEHNPFADDEEGGLEQGSSSTKATGWQSADSKDGDEANGHDDLAGLQQKQWNHQDHHLDALSASLHRQHELSLQMNEELDLHRELLEEFDSDVDRTGLRLGGATNQLDRLRSSIKDHSKLRSPTLFAS